MDEPAKSAPLFGLETVTFTPHAAGPTWESWGKACNGFDNIQRVGCRPPSALRGAGAARGLGWKRGPPAPLDHLIRPQQQRRRDRQAERLGGLEVDDQLELGRLLDGEVGGLRALEDLVHEVGGAPVPFGQWSYDKRPPASTSSCTANIVGSLVLSQLAMMCDRRVTGDEFRSARGGRRMPRRRRDILGSAPAFERYSQLRAAAWTAFMDWRPAWSDSQSTATRETLEDLLEQLEPFSH